MSRNKFVSLVVLVVYSTGSLPIQGICSECHVEVESMAKRLLVSAETGVEEAVSQKIKELDSVHDKIHIAPPSLGKPK